MIPYTRRQRILEMLQKQEVAFIDDIAPVLDVSSSTVRRDVQALVKSGEVIALRGGAIKVNDRPSELPSATKAHLRAPEKRAIGREAALLVERGDTIYLDSGTTALQMMPFLRGVEVRVVTTNTQVLALPLAAPVDLMFVGGDYASDIGSVAGPITEQILGNMFFDKAFLGASGVSREAGISTFTVREAAKKRIVHQNSSTTFVLADSSKLGRTTFYKALDLGECHIITDRDHELLASAAGSLVTSTTEDDPAEG